MQRGGGAREGEAGSGGAPGQADSDADDASTPRARGGVGRNGQIERVLQIIRDLARLGGVDLYELHERYGTSVRTIRRDLDALQAVGLPLVEEPDPSGGPRKRWRLAFREHLGQLADLLDVSHYLALRVAMGQAAPLGSSSALFAALEDLSDKIEKAIGPKGRAQLKAIDACFCSYEKFAYRRSAPDVFWPLVEAIAARRLCDVSYEAPRPAATAPASASCRSASSPTTARSTSTPTSLATIR